MQHARVVLVLAGIRASRSEWTEIEINMAASSSSRKSIISIEPRGSRRTSVPVKQVADRVVRIAAGAVAPTALRGRAQECAEPLRDGRVEPIAGADGSSGRVGHSAAALGARRQECREGHLRPDSTYCHERGYSRAPVRLQYTATRALHSCFPTMIE